jgi:hypothetical protein
LTPAAGDIVLVMAPSVGYRKYHLCLGQNEAGISLFLFLNSDNGFAGDAVFDCTRFPTVPPSQTGESVVSFSMMPRFSSQQLALYGATLHGTLSQDVAAELVGHCAQVKTLTKYEKQLALAVLSSLAA